MVSCLNNPARNGGLCALMLALMLAAPIASAGSAPALRLPPYVDPDEPLRGEVTANADAVTIQYRLDEADFLDVPAVAADNDAVAFSIPPLYETDARTMTIAVRDSESQSTLAQTTMPIAYTSHHDITGDAAVVLTYPLAIAEGHVEFIPCCTIYNGLVRALEIPVNPAETSAGLPEHTQSTFVVLDPDHLSATTAGLGLVLKAGDPPAPGLTPAVFTFVPRTGAWEPIANPEVDEVDGTIRIACPNGGAFVLGWHPVHQADR